MDIRKISYLRFLLKSVDIFRFELKQYTDDRPKYLCKMSPPLVFITYIVVCKIPVEKEEKFDDLSMIDISPFVRYRS